MNSLQPAESNQGWGTRLFAHIPRRTLQVHILLFVVTFISTTFSYWFFFTNMKASIAFCLWYSVPLMTILLAHEMGHYVQARRYGVDTTLPYFIPMPLLVGTMGAVIRMRSIPPGDRALFDIAFWGPAMSFLLSVPAVAVGVYLSDVQVLDSLEGAGGLVIFGDSVITRLLTVTLVDLPPGADLNGHPLLFAGWFGLFITAINLMPLGQLDGGHILYTLLGKRHKHLARVLFFGLLLLCLVSYQYLLWAALIFFLIKVEHPDYRRYQVRQKIGDLLGVEIRYRAEGLDRRRRILALASMLAFALTFVPIPIQVHETGKGGAQKPLKQEKPVSGGENLI